MKRLPSSGMAAPGCASRLMPAGDDVDRIGGLHPLPRRHSGEGGHQILERAHRPGFAVGRLLLDRKQRRLDDRGHMMMPGIPTTYLMIQRNHFAHAQHVSAPGLDESSQVDADVPGNFAGAGDGKTGKRLETGSKRFGKPHQGARKAGKVNLTGRGRLQLDIQDE
jgi:hypothetical protein